MCPSETRWYRNEQHTVNGLTAYKLALETIGVQGSGGKVITSYLLPQCAQVGIRVWRRLEDGTEEEITNGSPVASCFAPMGVSKVTYSASWTCPTTTLNLTDAIVVRVYGNLGTGFSLLKAFITEQLNASQLNNATWTVYYTLSTPYSYNPRLGTYRAGVYFYFDGTNQSRIENFTYTVGITTHKIGRLATNILIRPHAIVLIKRNDEIVGYRKPHAPFRPERPIQPEVS